MKPTTRKVIFILELKHSELVQNNEPVIKSLDKLSSIRRGKCMSTSTFDFSTLYTKIPHLKLISVLNELIDFCFQGDTNKLVAVTKFGARWVSNCSKHILTFDKARIKDAVKYLMENCQFYSRGKAFPTNHRYSNGF